MPMDVVRLGSLVEADLGVHGSVTPEDREAILKEAIAGGLGSEQLVAARRWLAQSTANLVVDQAAYVSAKNQTNQAFIDMLNDGPPIYTPEVGAALNRSIPAEHERDRARRRVDAYKEIDAAFTAHASTGARDSANYIISSKDAADGIFNRAQFIVQPRQPE